MLAVDVKNIKKTFKTKQDTVEAVKDVSFEVKKGEIFGLLGPNGAGKTTLMRIINQITAPDSGSLIFNGNILQPLHVAQIGYLPELNPLYLAYLFQFHLLTIEQYWAYAILYY